jgi:hypothetical protein
VTDVPAPAPDAAPVHDVSADASMSMEEAAGIAIRVIPAAALLVLLHWALHGGPSLREGFGFLSRLYVLIPALLVSVVVHEGLHALGFLFIGRAPRASVHFGIHRETLSPYAGCHEPLTAGAYRAAVALPGLVLGVAPVLFGLAGGTAWLTLWGSFMLVTAGGDLAVLLALRGVPSAARVVDHPTRVGGLVLR